MTERNRELVVGLAVLILIGLGLAVGAISDPVVPPADTKPASSYVERAWFCPPALATTEPGSTVAIATPDRVDVPLGIEAATQRRMDHRGDRVTLVNPEDDVALNAVGFGAPVAASSLITVNKPFEATGAANCSPRASTQWYFAEGSSGLNADERLLIYNPFPDEAVVAIDLFTSTGGESKAGLQRLGVPARDFIAVRLNEYAEAHPLVAASIQATRGRVVAWRAMLGEPDGAPSGFDMTLGVTRPATTWFFPEGAVQEGVEETISLLNPTEEEVTVTISLITSEQVVQPRELAEIPVPGGSARLISLPGRAGRNGPGSVSAVVYSTNDVALVAERTIKYDLDDVEGISSESGASESSPAWMLGPASRAPALDYVTILNTSPEKAEISIELLPETGKAPSSKDLRDISIPPGLRRRISVGEYTEGQAMYALVTSNVEVVAERSAYSAGPSDVALLMGVPFTPR